MPRLDLTASGCTALLTLACTACSDSRERLARSAEADTGPSGFHIVTAADFNGDGLQDVLWNDPVTNRLAVSLLRGTHLLEAGPALPGPRGPGWSAVTAVDFNLDGFADVPWFSPDTKRATIWLMEATHLAEPGQPIPGPAGEGWTVGYAGDFDGDGMGDLLWYNPDRALISVWLARGTCIFEPGPEIPGPVGPGWTVATAADFNLDGTADVLWSHADTSTIAVWLMWGTRVLEAGAPIRSPWGDGWAAITGADFNRDGMSDVIWNNPVKNQMAVSLMNGVRMVEAGPAIPGPAGEGWTVGSAGDTDGDGCADAMWQNTTTHRFAIWTMNATHVVVPGAELPGPL